MSCCGGGLSAAQVVAQGRALVDGGAAAGVLVKLVYTGDDRRNRPYVAEGKVYFFGANDHRRVNAVPARVLPQFLDPAGRYYGAFERYEESERLETGELETRDWWPGEWQRPGCGCGAGGEEGGPEGWLR